MNLIRDIGYGVYVILSCLGALPAELLRPQPFGRRRLYAAFVDIGLRPLATLTVLAALIGVIVGIEMNEALSVLSAEVLLIDAVRAAVLREFAPLLVGILLAGRSGVLLTARLGAMALTEESEAVIVMGADPHRHAMLPVLAALLLLAPLITAWCGLISIASTALTVEWQSTLPARQFIDLMLAGDLAGAALYGIAKSVVFALLVVSVAAVHGTKVARDVGQLPRMATRTFTDAFIAIIAVSALFLLLDTYGA